jgi:undecaprenyl pyrophosphate synthase
MAKNYLDNGKDITTITEESLSSYMDLGSLPHVEMVIRTK